ncbi:MAG: L-threonylcarbamoyladenylate synthase [Dehalococcoidia bacterium]
MKDKIIKVDAFRPDSAVIKQAAALINKGEVVVCPTDTGYAFCVNALNPKAIARVFDLKGRSFSNPVHVAVNTIGAAEEYARFNEAARYLADHYLPGALTIVLPKKEIIPPILVAGLDTIGIRIPDNNVILQLAEVAGKPLTTTSANISRQPAPYSVDEITGRPGINIEKIGLVLDQGVIPSHELSTIVDLSVEPAQLIRQGRISWLEIREVLHGHYNPE